ncbi:MAG TPA: AI-2E family transporter [Acidimicrobiales bacterium]|nr:AI-2E family transporter [Acidimicrobiales bacterium]
MPWDRRAAGGGVVDADAAALAALAGSVAAVVAVTGLARSVPRTIAATAIASLLALGLNPAVSLVERRLRIPRGGALAAVVAGFLASVGVLAFLLVPPAVEQVQDLDDDIPDAVAELAELPVVGGWVEEADVKDRAEEFLDDLPNRLLGDDTPLFDVGRRAADGLVAAAITTLLATALLLDGRRLSSTALRVLPERRRPRVERIGDLAYRAVGRYVAGSLSVAVVAGLFVLTLGLVMSVPLAPLLALWVMLWDLVPQIGGAAGGVPFVAFAFTQGAVPGVVCGVAFVLYLQIENNVLGPLLVGSAVKLSPPATMVAALVGVSAGGVVGALLAVPVTGAAKAVYTELRGPPPEEASPAGTASP